MVVFHAVLDGLSSDGGHSWAQAGTVPLEPFGANMNPAPITPERRLVLNAFDAGWIAHEQFAELSTRRPEVPADRLEALAGYRGGADNFEAEAAS